MKTADIRKAFIEYFKDKGHTAVASASLVPDNDPTLLFTVAGMVPFKDVFTGKSKRDYSRAVSAQRCVRAGGKHNDLENVGYTARHHTFFEMLGNFSFGDYFKREAIEFGWEFVTQVLKLPPEKLWVTTHISDDEAKAIWFDEIGIDQSRFSQLDEDNFWSSGDTGPCGPSSEIFYDHGPDVWGGPPGSPEEDGDRYIEIWNLVFMQYNRDSAGELHPLPNPSVDTGMGLERVAAILQGVHSNYEIDVFAGLIEAAAKAVGTSSVESPSLKVIADHVRSSSFLIADGVLPSNEGRGYVLRRIIRRAARHGHQLGADRPFLHTLVATLANWMGEAYPHLRDQQTDIERILEQEEEQFLRTLDLGMKELELALKGLADAKELPGEIAFKLYDTFGFPLDLTADVLREREMTVDEAGFDRCMQVQKERARESSQFSANAEGLEHVDGATEFTGYGQLEASATVHQLIADGQVVNKMISGQEGFLVVQSTPFYAESGGQVGDTGVIQAKAGSADVLDTTKSGDAFVHRIRVSDGALQQGDEVSMRVDESGRLATARHHSATHLLHAALRQVLGDHVTQKGSLVDAQRLRFDFSHSEAVKPEQLAIIERIINDQILSNTPVETEVMSPEAAQEKGAMALFGEKYGDEVRVLSMGSDGFSVELCGGTHVARTGDIGPFKVISESGVASGIRRIEAVAGHIALAHFAEQQRVLTQLAHEMKCDLNQVIERTQQLQSAQKAAEKSVRDLKQKLATGGGTDFTAEARKIGNVNVLAIQADSDDMEVLRSMVDTARSKLGSAVVMLAAGGDKRTALVCGVTKDVASHCCANEVMKHVADQLGGRGGGRPDMAQGSAPLVGADELDRVLGSVGEWVEAKIATLES